ncbi:MAG: RHS repeat-associated core domain-containing protein, partial [Lachnospiraceae bacterium]
ENLATGEKYCYNVYDEVISYTDAEGNTTEVTRNLSGDILTSTDALGNVTTYGYASDGSLAFVTDPSGAVTTYTYNDRGLPVKATDALGSVTEYAYDKNGNVIRVTSPDGTVTEYTYNTDGNVTKVTAAKADGETEVLRYLYALDGSLSAAISGTTTDCYTYTAGGNLATVTRNGSHTVEFAYDADGNLIQLKEALARVYAPEAVTRYSYDAAGRLVKVTEGGSPSYQVTYSADGTPVATALYEDGSLLAAYEYYADGMVKTQTDGAGNVSAYSYDRNKQVTQLQVTAADGSILYQENNRYDKNGSLVNRTVKGTSTDALSSSGTTTYTYDALDRLTAEKSAGRSTGYAYDVMGNRVEKTETDGTGSSAVTVITSYTYDLCNRLLSEERGGIVTAYTYDMAGNLTEKTEGNGTIRYAYDALNRLINVTNSDGGWQENSYDASGIRSMLTENGRTTEYVTCGGLMLAGYDRNGERTEHYFYGNGLLAAETGTSEENVSGEEHSLYYYLKNFHGDIIALTDTTGILLDAYVYDAFGNLTARLKDTGNTIALKTAEAAAPQNRFLYSGEQYDETAELYYLRARYYSTDIGRFTQKDTYLGDGHNLYAYVGNNPLKYVDPSGHD